MPANECAATMCGRGIHRARLMCKPHWYQVPRHLRAAIRRLYDAEVAPFIARLKKLMDDAAAGCPLETCEIVIAVTSDRSAHNDRRIAAALDLSEVQR